MGVYVHVPFCVRKCGYCDFDSSEGFAGEDVSAYFEALDPDVERIARLEWVSGVPVGTVFFGGGTPSAVDPRHLERVMERLGKTFDLVSGMEVTMEANPESVCKESSAAWKSLGVNRVSLGVQSLCDTELGRLGRLHDARAARRAFDVLRAAGFDNLGVDLMFGLDGQRPQSWMKTLSEVVSLSPEHVSAYVLTVEAGTPLERESRRGSFRPPDEDSILTMFHDTREILAKAGMPAYEISNFARPGFACRHNLLYWRGGDYLGFGASAHSFLRGRGGIRRFWNPRGASQYVRSVREGGLPEREEIPSVVHFGERLMTGLRLTVGVDLGALKADLGMSVPAGILEALERYTKSGHIERDGGVIRLTYDGMLLSDSIFCDLLI